MGTYGIKSEALAQPDSVGQPVAAAAGGANILESLGTEFFSAWVQRALHVPEAEVLAVATDAGLSVAAWRGLESIVQTVLIEQLSRVLGKLKL